MEADGRGAWGGLSTRLCVKWTAIRELCTAQGLCSILCKNLNGRESGKEQTYMHNAYVPCWAQRLSPARLLVTPRTEPARLLSYPWRSPGQNTGVACHFLLQIMCICITKALCCTLENNTTLYINYALIKKKNFKKKRLKK